MDLILIRHGEIDSNVAKIYSGRSDEPLNATGRIQAQTAADRLQNMEIGALITSPLRRALETSRIIGERIGRAPQVSEFFNELRMGPWEGLSESAVAERYPEACNIWNSRPAELCLEGRETLDALQKRALRGAHKLRALAGNGHLAIVSHVAVIRVLMLYAEKRPLNDYKKIDVPNASAILINLD